MDRKALYTVLSLRFMLLAALYMLSFLAEPSSSSIALPVSLSLQSADAIRPVVFFFWVSS